MRERLSPSPATACLRLGWAAPAQAPPAAPMHLFTTIHSARVPR